MCVVSYKVTDQNRVNGQKQPVPVVGGHALSINPSTDEFSGDKKVSHLAPCMETQKVLVTLSEALWKVSIDVKNQLHRGGRQGTLLSMRPRSLHLPTRPAYCL